MQDYWFFPNAPILVLNRVQESLVKDLLSIIKLRRTWISTNPVDVSVPILMIYDAIVSDVCAYVSKFNYSSTVHVVSEY